jgi:hypothetical protein
MFSFDVLLFLLFSQCVQMSDPSASRVPRKRRGAHSTSDGNKCCIVGCNASSAACRGLSFFRIPTKGVSESKDKWRVAVIARISRQDKSFNPDKSQGLQDECIKHGMCVLSGYYFL